MAEEADEVIWTCLDASFHVTIAQATGNPVFADVLATIASALGGQSGMLNVQRNRRASSAAERRTIAIARVSPVEVEAEDARRYHAGEVREALAVSMTADP